MTDIPYFDGLMGEEQREITDSIRLLLRQTFILERKYDRRTGRFQYNREFRICNKNLDDGCGVYTHLFFHQRHIGL